MAFDKDTQLIFSKFSHELRNPLTTLYSTIQFLELKHPEVKEFKYWPTLSHDIEHINQLIDAWSDLSKSESLNLSTFDFRAFLEQLSLSFAASIAHSKVTYTAKIDTSIHQITGDKTKLQEVFSNLLKNAFEASQPDEHIYLHAYLCGTVLSVIIKDTGCGMSKEQLSTIFEPFVTYKQHGLGLGLPICKQIIESHKGSLSVVSSKDTGTTFCVQLNTEWKGD